MKAKWIFKPSDFFTMLEGLVLLTVMFIGYIIALPIIAIGFVLKRLNL